MYISSFFFALFFLSALPSSPPLEQWQCWERLYENEQNVSETELVRVCLNGERNISLEFGDGTNREMVMVQAGPIDQFWMFDDRTVYQCVFRPLTEVFRARCLPQSNIELRVLEWALHQISE